ncbi:YitT family protein [Carnobacterium sp. ISL-102]|uniref:YitT family protein n=1 Tax=Carnobacterium sp. ISL-102 TaxID=2819142 RepID=UPI001BE8259C|nr:YitT family protein [Carnobacterium sp. ISL-102]MBT2731681.1 YitT family protein [Carnobacterium sp. ISL-102]
MKKKVLSNKYALGALDILYIIVGSFIAAVAFNVFLLPNVIVSGGISGVSTITSSVFSWDPSVVQLAFNIPLLLICFIFLGKEAGYKTILGSFILPVFIGMLNFMEPWTDAPLLAALFGGVVTGIGLGIVFRAKASTGGTSIIAQIIHEHLRLPLGMSVAIIDGLVIVCALLVFDSEVVMYSIISLFVISRTIDVVQVGFNHSKTVMIISEYPVEVKQAIFNTINRGVTNLGIKGGYGNSDREMLMCVVAEQEFTLLKDAILDVDENAFVVVMSASEVWGRGFTLAKEKTII